MTGREMGLRNKSIEQTFKRFLRNDSGATAIEYGLLAALLAVGIIVGADGIGNVVTTMWNGVSTDVGGT